jgi:hypothetical protein
MKDERTDGLLQECGRVAWRLGLALAWTDSLEGEAAKACSRSGAAAWKNATPLPDNEQAAVAFFTARARKRNPAVVASRSNLVLIEFDGELVELCAQYELWDLPDTATARSRRGPHLYYRPPAGRAGMKVQLDASRVLVSEDDYTVAAGALHSSGHVYTYEHPGPIVELPAGTYDLLLELHEHAQADTREGVANGQLVREGQRHEALKLRVLQLVRSGVEPGRLLDDALEFNREYFRPPLAEKEVSRQVRGLVGWAARHPTEERRASEAARRHLEERRAAAGPRQTTTGVRVRRQLRSRSIASVLSRPVRWLLPGMIPMSTITLVAGIGGLGKSTWLMSVAAGVTRGLFGDPAGVLIVSYEDPVDLVLRPRLLAADADLELVSELYVEVDGVDGVEGLVLPGDLAALGQEVEARAARMVVIDPIIAAVDISLDSHKDQHVRHVLARLTAIAERHECAIPIVGHLNKQPGSDAYIRVANSAAFWNAARSVVLLAPDPTSEDDSLRLVAQRKANWSRARTVQRWRLEETLVRDSGHVHATSRIVFVEDADDVDPEMILVNVRRRDEGQFERAVEFLEHALDDGDWHDSVGLVKLAVARRISERTLRRAAFDELQVEHERRGFPSSTWWRLSSRAKPCPTDLA